ncbi:MAG: lycopene cyclase domain-containing protein [Ferruginibacter sp.]
MTPKYTYFLILTASLIGPLLLSFDRKVSFYKKWKFLFPAMLLPAAFYIVWDIYFTAEHVWSFNPAYITGIKLINLPVEEVLFFFVIPYCCVFIYECIRCYFPLLKDGRSSSFILKITGAFLFVTGSIFFHKAYTGYTFVFTGIFIAILFIYRKYFVNFHITTFLTSFIISLFPFLIVNGFLTAIPVVMYNDAENLGIRIYRIPLEDVFYGMLLIMINITIYEKLKTQAI